MKKLIYILLICWCSGKSQDLDFNNYLLIGVEQAEDLTAIYLEPLSEGLTYGLTGGWFNSAVSKKKWSIELSLVSNGSFIPSDRLSKDINISEIPDLEVLGGGDVVAIPTILGSKESSVTLVTTVNDEIVTFDAPTGIGLINLNLLPTAFIQANIGIPGDSEVALRYFPKIGISDVTLGMLGMAFKHDLSQSIGILKASPIALAAMAGFTRLDAEYSFQADGFVTGNNQLAEGSLNAWVFELMASTKNPIYNVYGGIGYVTGNADYSLKGTYIIQTQMEPLVFNDPFDVQNSASGLRVNVGGKVRMGWFNLNLGYTFQGFNNLSLGLNFDIYNPKN